MDLTLLLQPKVLIMQPPRFILLRSPAPALNHLKIEALVPKRLPRLTLTFPLKALAADCGVSRPD